MRLTCLAFLLALPSASFTAGNPCVRTIGRHHEAALVSAGATELQIQTECLAWESSAPLKADFALSPSSPVPRPAVSPAVRPEVPRHGQPLDPQTGLAK